jgi:hypothetical protein
VKHFYCIHPSPAIFNAVQNTLSIMARTPDQNSVSTAIVTAVIIGSCIALISIMPIFLTGLYIYIGSIWGVMVTNRTNYLPWNELRKEWNKKAAIEIRRQFIMGLILHDTVRKRGIRSVEWWRYKSMVSIYNSNKFSWFYFSLGTDNILSSEKTDSTSLDSQFLWSMG